LYLTDYFDENNEDISLKGSEEYSFDTNDENNSIDVGNYDQKYT
jgi:hypothetical protein